jgi:hypothetical protein
VEHYARRCEKGGRMLSKAKKMRLPVNCRAPTSKEEWPLSDNAAGSAVTASIDGGGWLRFGLSLEDGGESEEGCEGIHLCVV